MSRFARTNHGKGHSYTWQGQRMPGVTTAIGAVLDKPALVAWAANQTASYAIDHWDSLSDIPLLERYEQLKGARWETNRAAIVTGHRIHDLGERLAHGREVEVPGDIRPQVEAYARFLDDWDVEVLLTESPVAHSGYRYAGTLDMVAKVGKLDGMQLVIDLKTGKGVYAETALQQVAYTRADLCLISEEQPPGPRGGRRKPIWVEHPMPEVVGAAVAHIIPETEGSPARVDLLPVDTSDDVWATWLYVLELYRTWTERSNPKSDVFAPPIGEPIYPEQDNPFWED